MHRLRRPFLDEGGAGRRPVSRGTGMERSEAIMPGPEISILFLTWNSREEILDGVRSALAQTASGIEVIVFDNASEDGSADLVAETFGSRVRVICFEDNLGYVGGYNRALRFAQGEWLVLVNPDVRLEADFVAQARGAFDDPRVGIVAGRLMRPDGQTIDSTGQFLARSRKTIDRGYGQRYDPERDREGSVLSACGAAAIYRRAMIEDISDDGEFFDVSYFAFHEDLEVGWRAWRAGWVAVYRPQAVATHLRAGGREAGFFGLGFRRSPAVIAHIVKNRYLSILRHDSTLAFFVDLPFILVRDLKLLFALAMFRPAVFRELWAWRACFRSMRCRRREDRRRHGRWGPWKRVTPPRGIW